MSDEWTRAACAALDASDPLAELRDAFSLPEGLVYLDGNSLGALAKSVAGAVAATITSEWGTGLVRSWNDAGWWEKPCALGAQLAPLLGAGRDEVVVCDSTSINIAKVLGAAAGLVGARTTVVAESQCFPTDRYILASIAGLCGLELRLVESGPAAVEAALDATVGIVFLNHVDYRSAAMFDMAAMTRAAHDAGALMIWDLAHAAGAVRLELDECGVDFAVGCTYKYLNGGPGSPAFVYAARRHLEDVTQPLAGWHGHARPFDFEPDYAPAPGIRRFLVGSPPLIAYAALEAALGVFASVDMDALVAKSRSLSTLLIDLVDARCPEVVLASPRDPSARGSHVALSHHGAFEIVHALGRVGVLGDFREPDVIRLGLTPLYLRYVDVFDAVVALRAVLDAAPWDTTTRQARPTVT